MNDTIQKALNVFHSVLNEELGSNVVKVTIAISSHEYSFDVEVRRPAQLKLDGISTKNIRGEWISLNLK